MDAVMPVPEIHQLHPQRSPHPLDDDQILALYTPRDRTVPIVRANFVSTVDGASTIGGLSGPLGGPADKRVFDLLRQLSDVVVVGAGTLRAEGYGAMRLSAEASRWRRDHGLPAQPHFAIVSVSLDLEATSDVFANAPVRPIVVTVDSADDRARQQLARVADVIICGDVRVGARQLVETLSARGLNQLHCEGGPHLLGTLFAEDVLDELCLTTSPLLEGGLSPRIVSGGGDAISLPMSLDHVMMSENTLFTKYSRMRD